MLSQPSTQQGLSLVELMIAIVIAGILLTVGVGSYATWTQNQKIRMVAESILNGMQLARAEAVTRNTRVQFALAPDTGWVVNVIDGGVIGAEIQSRPAAESTGAATVSMTPAGATVVTFNSLGRPIADPTPAANTTITQVEVTSSSSAADRPLRISIGNGGGVKMCDPRATAGDPRAC